MCPRIVLLRKYPVVHFLKQQLVCRELRSCSGLPVRWYETAVSSTHVESRSPQYLRIVQPRLMTRRKVHSFADLQRTTRQTVNTMQSACVHVHR